MQNQENSLGSPVHYKVLVYWDGNHKHGCPTVVSFPQYVDNDQRMLKIINTIKSASDTSQEFSIGSSSIKRITEEQYLGFKAMFPHNCYSE